MKWKIKTVLVVLLMLSLTAGVMSIQYGKSPGANTNTTISTKDSMIQFIARDIDEFDYSTTQYVLNNSSGTYTLHLGNWMGGTKRTWVTAFAIVNVEPYPIRVTSAEVSGEAANWLRIYAHANPTIPVDSSVLPPDIICEQNQNFSLLYNGDGGGRTGGQSYWKLANGTGYVGSYLGYDNNTSYAGGKWPYNNATWDDNNKLWVFNSSSQHMINDTATWGYANFVWIEIVLIVPTGVETKDYTGTIKFFTESET
ncbi:MAG: hypothetical protein QW620_03230 [Thermoplasmata archaeon]